MITFAQAREIAKGVARKSWEPMMGDLFVSPHGKMDAHEYALFYGARQYMEDQVEQYFIPDLPVIFVDKRTGETRTGSYIENAKQIRDMTELTDSA